MNRHSPRRFRFARSISSAMPASPLAAVFCCVIIGVVIVGVTFSCTLLHAQDTVPKLAAKSTNEAIALYRDGILFYNDAKWDLAADEFGELLKDHPQDPLKPKTLHYLGICQLQLKNHDAAAATLGKLIRQFPKFASLDQTYFYFGFSHYRLGEGGKRPSFNNAAAAFAHLAKTYPQSKLLPQALYYQAEALYASGKAAAAVAPYKRLLADHPKSSLVADAMYGLGWTYEELKKFDEAGAIYDQFLKSFPKHALAAEIKMQKGETLLSKGLYKEAAPWFEAASNAPGFASAGHALFQLATCAFEQKDFQGASGLYMSVVKNYPKSPDATLAAMNGGKSLFQLGKHAESRAALASLIAAAGPTAAEATHLTARSLIAEKNPAAALALLAKQIPAATGNRWEVNLLMDRADATFEIADKRSESIALYGEVAAKFSEHALAADAIYMAGFAAFQVGEHELVLQLADQFGQMFPKHRLSVEVSYNAAESQLMLKKFDLAEARLRTLLSTHTAHRDLALWKKRLGYALYSQRKSQAAIDQLLPLLPQIKKPKSVAEVQYWLGSSYQQLKQQDQAAEHFKQVIKTRTGSIYTPYAIHGLGLAQLLRKQYAEAAASFTALLEKHPKHTLSADTLFRRGQAYQSLRKFQGAIDDLTKYLATGPAKARKSDARLVLGICQDRLKKPADAIKTYKTLLADDAAYSAADGVLFELGWSLNGVNTKPSLAEAASTFTKLVTDFPNSTHVPESQAALGVYYYNSRQYAKAVTSYTAAMKNLPQDAAGERAVHFLGQANYHLKAYDKAQQAFQRQVTDYPAGKMIADGLFMLGESLFKQQRYQPALAAFTRATAKKPSLERATMLALLRTGQCAAQLKQWQASLGPLEALIKNHPTSSYAADALYEAGWSKRNLADAASAAGQAKQASALYGEAVELFNSSARKAINREVGARARFMMGEIYSLQKNHKEAIRNYLKVALGYKNADAQTETWKAKASYSLGRVYSAMKLAKDSRKWYQATIDKYPKSPEAAEAKQRLAGPTNK